MGGGGQSLEGLLKGRSFSSCNGSSEYNGKFEERFQDDLSSMFARRTTGPRMTGLQPRI